MTSIAPVLLIVIAVAGLAFGHDAAQNAITTQLSRPDGPANRRRHPIRHSERQPYLRSGVWATIIGIATLILTASGVFGEMQTALNSIWKAKPQGTTVSRLIRARAASLGLVATLGFLLMVSLVVSTGLTAFGNYLDSILPFGKVVLFVLNGLVSILLISLLFAAIYKVLPDRKIEWRDVAVGALVTAILVHDRKIADQLVLGKQRSFFQLWCCGRTNRLVVVGVLFSPDLFDGSRIYESFLSQAR